MISSYVAEQQEPLTSPTLFSSLLSFFPLACVPPHSDTPDPLFVFFFPKQGFQIPFEDPRTLVTLPYKEHDKWCFSSVSLRH